ncbi:uncharacterized protein LOC114665711 isoform X1 [Erpetoichthys calabaricus]|uniref:uncharacterized protein LOC114665711 isoform X1 n=1 Tax=Erpetoichthys calabaricus TaxID=27687 RepID=UPI0022343C3B|nr:uncharacterized protein LOC114665711 isoform X1 [Erpetoichthys calabaricus]
MKTYLSAALLLAAMFLLDTADSRVLSKCDMASQLNAALKDLPQFTPQILAKIICHINATGGFSTSAVSVCPPNMPGQGTGSNPPNTGFNGVQQHRQKRSQNDHGMMGEQHKNGNDQGMGKGEQHKNGNDQGKGKGEQHKNGHNFGNRQRRAAKDNAGPMVPDKSQTNHKNGEGHPLKPTMQPGQPTPPRRQQRAAKDNAGHMMPGMSQPHQMPGMKPGGSNSPSMNSMQLLGALQIPSHLACNDGITKSDDQCKMSCNLLTDEDIADDLACLKKIIKNVDQSKYDRFTTACSNMDLSTYLSECSL